jgi:hypothetical protein
LGAIYASFGTAYHDRFLLITRNTVSNVAQQFGPVDFWQRRTAVADAMLAAVRASLLAIDFFRRLLSTCRSLSFSHLSFSLFLSHSQSH